MKRKQEPKKFKKILQKLCILYSKLCRISLSVVCIQQRADKVTAFHMACEQGSVPIVQFLTSKDPAICRITLVDCRGRTPLHMAAGKNHIHVAEFLLENVGITLFRDNKKITEITV